MTTASRRTAPLAAQPEPVDEIQVHDRPEAGDLDDVVAVAPALDPATRAERDARFADGVRTLRVGGASLRLDERVLMILGGVVAPLGLVVVLLGWWGAAHTPYVFEQLPYLISGGLLGVGLIFLGAFFYFAHWMTQLVKEHRVQSQAVLEALQRLQDQVAEQARPRLTAGAASTNGTHRHEVTLVATERGTMAHRPECVVVAGKTSLRPVTPAEGVSACKLCEPF
jgi:hypothetical protein